MKYIIFIFIFIGCDSAVGTSFNYKNNHTSTSKQIANSNFNMEENNNNQITLQRIKQLSTNNNILIKRNITDKKHINTQEDEHIFDITSLNIVCNAIREDYILTNKNNTFYKMYRILNSRLFCTEYNFANTNSSGNKILMSLQPVSNKGVIYDKNTSHADDMKPFNNTLNAQYSNPDKTSNDFMITEEQFDIQKIKNQAKTKWFIIFRNISKDYYRKNMLHKYALSTSYYDVESKIKCQDIISDYSIRNLFKDVNDIDYPKYFIKDYYSIKQNSWCRDFDTAGSTEQGNNIFIYAYEP